MKKSIFLFLILFCAGSVVAQQKEWTLQQCIDFALINNTGVQQRQLQEQEQQNRLQTTTASRLPSVSASVSENVGLGLPSSSQTDGSFSLGASASVPIFSGFSIKNTIKVNELNLRAAIEDTQSAKEDLSLNITNLFLQVLFRIEILRVSESQVALSALQLDKTKILVAKGKSAESEIAESESVYARDVLSRTQATHSLRLALLDLSQAMNLENSDDFKIKIPAMDDFAIAGLGNQKSPSQINNIAQDKPRIRAAELRSESAQGQIEIAKAGLYPRISLGASYGNGFSHTIFKPYIDTQIWDQLGHGSRQSVGVSMSIPIFSGFSTRNNIRSSKISARNQELSLVEARRSLYKEIEQAYYNAIGAREKHNAASQALNAARVAMESQTKKMDAQMATIFDFNDAKTRLERAESDMIQAKYEYIFAAKVLDYYAGQPLEFKIY